MMGRVCLIGILGTWIQVSKSTYDIENLKASVIDKLLEKGEKA